ncbi:MAG: DUF3021 family protein [Clostridium sp.]|nr:DUF3021 family protein [Clostridium sp.]
MKVFFDKSYEIKSLWGTFYMGIMLTYGILCFFIKNYNISIDLIWQVFIMSAFATFYQYIFYGEYFMVKLNSKLKVGIHYLLFLVTVIVLNNIFNWFNWLIVFSVFTFYYVLVSIFYMIYNKSSGEKFNEKLLNYKKRRG